VLLVYRDVVKTVPTHACFDRIRRRIQAGDVIGALIIAGELEQGVLDAVDAKTDDWTELHATLRTMVLATAALARGRGSARALFAACDAVRSRELPDTIACRAPEGYCHYALDPIAYAHAAARYTGDGRICDLVIAVRSIGTSLSAVVANTLNAPSVTVRARGESGAREVIASDRLMAHALRQLERGGDVAIVDEGPGATGETFHAVARWCGELGVDDNRIVLFPSHPGNSPLAPPDRRTWLDRAVRYPPPPEEKGRTAAEAAGFDCIVSISAGQWRTHVSTGPRLPAACNFERTKYLGRRGGQWWHIRFAGAGEWGEDVLQRTCRLAERGCASRARALKHGFIALPWIDGAPISRRSTRREDGMQAAKYLQARLRLFPADRPVPRGVFVRVLQEHALEAGLKPAAVAGAVKRIERLPQREAFIGDARIAPHEWIRTRSGLLWKVDAVDHGDGFRLPGPADAMWDCAGWLVEFGDPAVDLRQVFPDLSAEDEAAAKAYAPAYAAVAFGDALLSAREAANPRDRRILLSEARFYRAALRSFLRAS